MTEQLQLIGTFLRGGGPVLFLLLALGTWLWTILGLRALVLARGYEGPAEEVWTRPPDKPGVVTRALEAARSANTVREARSEIERVRATLRRFRRSVRIISATAPMLGLIGTVMGMIRTFDALGQSGATEGVAAGISEALITTEVGLALAIPGLIVGVYLDRREGRRHVDLDILVRTAEVKS